MNPAERKFSETSHEVARFEWRPAYHRVTSVIEKQDSFTCILDHNIIHLVINRPFEVYSNSCAPCPSSLTSIDVVDEMGRFRLNRGACVKVASLLRT